MKPIKLVEIKSLTDDILGNFVDISFNYHFIINSELTMKPTKLTEIKILTNDILGNYMDINFNILVLSVF